MNNKEKKPTPQGKMVFEYSVYTLKMQRKKYFLLRWWLLQRTDLSYLIERLLNLCGFVLIFWFTFWLKYLISEKVIIFIVTSAINLNVISDYLYNYNFNHFLSLDTYDLCLYTNATKYFFDNYFCHWFPKSRLQILHN